MSLKNLRDNWEIISLIVVIIFSAGIIWANVSEVAGIKQDIKQIREDLGYLKGYIEAKKD